MKQKIALGLAIFVIGVASFDGGLYYARHNWATFKDGSAAAYHADLTKALTHDCTYFDGTTQGFGEKPQAEIFLQFTCKIETEVEYPSIK